MRTMNHSAEALLAEAATCRRIAAGMGVDPLALSLIEIAEDYEARAAALVPTRIAISDRPPGRCLCGGTFPIRGHFTN